MDDKKRHELMLEQMREHQRESIHHEHLHHGTFLSHLLKLVFGTLILILVFSYFLAGGNFLKVLEGKMVSAEIDSEFVVNLEDGTKVLLSSDIYNKLLAIYTSSGGNEIKTCLLGSVDDDIYKVTALYVPTIYSQTGISVVSEPCDKNTIISLHSHPVEMCLFSKQDIDTYESQLENNPDLIIGLMCSKTRFSFYRR